MARNRIIAICLLALAAAAFCPDRSRADQERKNLQLDVIINDSPIKEVAVTDTIAIADERKPRQLVVLSVGELLSKAIRFTHAEQSVSSLFD